MRRKNTTSDMMKDYMAEALCRGEPLYLLSEFWLKKRNHKTLFQSNYLQS